MGVWGTFLRHVCKLTKPFFPENLYAARILLTDLRRDGRHEHLLLRPVLPHLCRCVLSFPASVS